MMRVAGWAPVLPAGLGRACRERVHCCGPAERRAAGGCAAVGASSCSVGLRRSSRVQEQVVREAGRELFCGCRQRRGAQRQRPAGHRQRRARGHRKERRGALHAVACRAHGPRAWTGARASVESHAAGQGARAAGPICLNVLHHSDDMIRIHNSLTGEKQHAAADQAGPGRHVCLRHDGVRLHAYRACAHDDRVRCGQPLSALPRLSRSRMSATSRISTTRSSGAPPRTASRSTRSRSGSFAAMQRGLRAARDRAAGSRAARHAVRARHRSR